MHSMHSFFEESLTLSKVMDSGTQIHHYSIAKVLARFGNVSMYGVGSVSQVIVLG